MQTTKFKTISALASIPFLVLFVLNLTVLKDFFGSQLVMKNFWLTSNFLLLNNIHICFSWFLFYKIGEFRDVCGNYRASLMIGVSAVLAAGLLLSGYNLYVFSAAAAAHALFQSTGLFLLWFTPGSQRQLVKILGWMTLIIVVPRNLGLIHIPEWISYSIGAMSFGAFAWISRSWLGTLFAFRFFLWFSPLVSSGPSIGAIHGIEYALVIAQLVAAKKISLDVKDFGIAALLIALPAYYTLSEYFASSFLVLNIAFFCFAYSHYIFDAYCFRFRLARQRAAILPLFSR